MGSLGRIKSSRYFSKNTQLASQYPKLLLPCNVKRMRFCTDLFNFHYLIMLTEAK